MLARRRRPRARCPGLLGVGSGGPNRQGGRARRGTAPVGRLPALSTAPVVTYTSDCRSSSASRVCSFRPPACRCRRPRRVLQRGRRLHSHQHRRSLPFASPAIPERPRATRKCSFTPSSITTLHGDVWDDMTMYRDIGLLLEVAGCVPPTCLRVGRRDRRVCWWLGGPYRERTVSRLPQRETRSEGHATHGSQLLRRPPCLIST